MRVLGRILPSLPTMGFPSCCRDLLPRRFIPQPCATFTEEEPSARGQSTCCKYKSAWVRPVQCPWSLYARTVMDAAFWHKIVQIKKNSRYFFQDYNQLFLKRQGTAAGSSNGGGATPQCDGQDELGCYQVRLYYDWFLIPGSCKCWKNDFFDQYTNKRR